MEETDAGRAVANPRRTRLGPDWTAGSTGSVDPRPNPGPGTGASAGNAHSAEPL
ncbi:hypothetical protein [Saccharothrix australiensis]|uniref:Uncharacterized protein n=1 Tax=Saccharothrix australiensis TaxID=2072 RepID=A0A495VZI9_9PSEU|nr:hypothetical protein [Saccharothrix australiensis]RKT54756.1 hypothetical protein C8E97_3404 [Saccharothrix australiensis]